ncbi:uncharacterized protein LOC141526028 [Cotesia typhae]|uniref:uncharacterized protein LOC141526028 n=1 Tax=Cotesia typhae TaxID=2053667 RepID=UPI003D6858F2
MSVVLRFNDLTLKTSSAILEILEMPQLLETCLRSSQVVAHLGITVNELQEEGMTYLDRKKVVEPSFSFSPIKSMIQDPLMPINLPESLRQPSIQTIVVETPELEPVKNIAKSQAEKSKVQLEVESNKNLDDQQIDTNKE